MAYTGAAAYTWEFGQSDYTNFLRVWSGMVEASYARMACTEGIFPYRRISHGKSVSWPLTGIGRAVYHTKGESVLQQKVSAAGASTYLSTPFAGEKLILIDNPLTASEFVADFDEFMSHYSIRASVAQILGEALAIENDLNRLMVLCNAAASTAIAGTSTDDGTMGSWADEGTIRIDSGTEFLDTASAIRASFKAMAQAFNEKQIPQEGRYAFVKPATYATLADDNTLTSADWRDVGGSLGRHRIMNLHGFDVIMTNRLADLNAYADTYDASAGAKTGQRGTDYTLSDFSKVNGIFCQKGAMASIELNTTALKHEESVERLGHLFLAHKTVGHGWLRQSAVGLSVTAAVTA